MFQVSLPEQNTIRKSWMDEISLQELNKSNSEEYKIETICNNKVYTNKSKGHLSGLYYLVFWKSYLKEKNTWEPALAI